MKPHGPTFSSPLQQQGERFHENNRATHTLPAWVEIHRFYFEPVQAGKNVWLAVQGMSIAVYVVGVMFAFSSIRNRSAALVPAMAR